MGVALKFDRNMVFDGALDRHFVTARCDASAVADAEDMGVNGLRGMVKPHVQDHIGRLAPDAGQRLQRRAA